MFDLSRLSVEPHVRNAIHEYQLIERAQERVHKGVVFLDKHAPREWRLNMMNIHGGVVSSRVRMVFDDQNPLALAFRHNATLRRIDGRVTWGQVSHKFDFTNAHYQTLGFLEMGHRCGTVLVTEDVDAELLDFAWAEALNNFEWRAQPWHLFPKAA